MKYARPGLLSLVPAPQNTPALYKSPPSLPTLLASLITELPRWPYPELFTPL